MAINPGSWIDGLRRIDRLISLEKKHGDLIEKQKQEIQELKDRLTKLEAHVQAREEILVAEAKGAAAAVASTVASQHVAGLAQSIGRLQGRLDGASGRSLPAPTDEA
jgi:VIT1/CCC1 family predicted Fe2+/Mn2+ transporter